MAPQRKTTQAARRRPPAHGHTSSCGPGRGKKQGGKQRERTKIESNNKDHGRPDRTGASITRRNAHDATRRDGARKRRKHTARTQRPSGWPSNGECTGGEGGRTGQQRHQRQYWSPLRTAQRERRRRTDSRGCEAGRQRHFERSVTSLRGGRHTTRGVTSEEVGAHTAWDGQRQNK